MLFRRMRRRPPESTIATLYGAIVAQARNPSFYLGYGVPDTLEGRFDMIVLHEFLFLRRIEREERDLGAIGQAVFDRFCRDLDHNLREMGVSDIAVPRKMRDFAQAYYGRTQVYGHALASDDQEACAAALARNVFSSNDLAGSGAMRLANYMREAARQLDTAAASAFAQGLLTFPDPETIPESTMTPDLTTVRDGPTLSP
jgi:cytochrome b pre-mRNA-processing protein 3